VSESRHLPDRFLPPDAGQRSRQREPWGPGELFAEGPWQSIRLSLEHQGWSASQIERLHDHLRQGWPLSMAKQNVAELSRQCPLRSRFSAL